jgi:hypothetical protein
MRASLGTRAGSDSPWLKNRYFLVVVNNLEASGEVRQGDIADSSEDINSISEASKISKNKKIFVPKVTSIKTPPGTVWNGGPMDRCTVTLRITGSDVEPDAISQMLGCIPTSIVRDRKSKNMFTGEVFVNSDWRLRLTSEETGITEINGLIAKLLEQLPSDPHVWLELNRRLKVDLFCGVFMETDNRGFGLEPAVIQALAERSLAVGFDIYGPSDQQ